MFEQDGASIAMKSEPKGSIPTPANNALTPQAQAYQTLLSQISSAYTAGKVSAIQAVNVQLLETYWRIGQHVVEFEQGGSTKAAYGKALLKQLAKDLTLLHGKGFSRSNLYMMRQFFILYPKFPTSGISQLLTYLDERTTFCFQISTLFARQRRVSATIRENSCVGT